MLAALASAASATAFVAIARRRLGGPLWTPANMLTLTRAASASGLAAQAAGPRPVRLAWVGLLLACTVSDWLDGPAARRWGTTRLGAVLDLEADSWLTLWAAVAAWRARALPAWCLLAPLVRYPLRVLRAAHRPMGMRAWQRAAGGLHMAVLVGALSPWPAVRRGAARTAPAAALLQLAALAADYPAVPVSPPAATGGCAPGASGR